MSDQPELPPCPECKSAYTCQDGEQCICPECAHEWSAKPAEAVVEEARVWKDTSGNVLVAACAF